MGDKAFERHWRVCRRELESESPDDAVEGGAFERLRTHKKALQDQGWRRPTHNVPAGEFYFDTKASGRRSCLDSLSGPARQVYACLGLGSMGYRRELAVWKDDEGGKPYRMNVSRIATITKLDTGTVRRALRELETPVWSSENRSTPNARW